MRYRRHDKRRQRSQIDRSAAHRDVELALQIRREHALEAHKDSNDVLDSALLRAAARRRVAWQSKGKRPVKRSATAHVLCLVTVWRDRTK